MKPFIHPSAIVETASIGNGTRVWAFAHVLAGAVIGDDCNVCDHCFIESDVVLGNRVTVKCGIYLWNGTIVEDDAFLGPAVVFTNDLRPRSKHYKTAVQTLIRKGASLGAGTNVLAGVTIGAHAMTGIGSVVTRDVPAYALVYGNPARFRAWIDEDGRDLISAGDGLWRSEDGARYQETPTGLAKRE
jgi:acetyltransferase-like isoleucine patch superfamily enzyme